MLFMLCFHFMCVNCHFRVFHLGVLDSYFFPREGFLITVSSAGLNSGTLFQRQKYVSLDQHLKCHQTHIQTIVLLFLQLVSHEYDPNQLNPVNSFMGLAYVAAERSTMHFVVNLLYNLIIRSLVCIKVSFQPGQTPSYRRKTHAKMHQ